MLVFQTSLGGVSLRCSGRPETYRKPPKAETYCFPFDGFGDLYHGLACREAGLRFPVVFAG